MHNTYFVIRHAKSKANALGVIVSHPQTGREDAYTLSPEGESQARAAGQKAKEVLPPTTIIISSPFSRCKRTAEIIKEELKTEEPISFDDRLGERWFGEWEKSAGKNYHAVWEKDAKDPNGTENDVESTRSVEKRMRAVIDELEHTYQGRTMLLVSHGDPLQILLTSMLGSSVGNHRDQPPLGVAEMRPLQAAS